MYAATRAARVPVLTRSGARLVFADISTGVRVLSYRPLFWHIERNSLPPARREEA